MTFTRGTLTAFVGSYADQHQPGIHAVSLTPNPWRLETITGWDGVTNPSFVAFGHRSDRLYAVSETTGDDGRVHAFALDWHRGTPSLTPIGNAPTGGDLPCHLGVDPGGGWLAVSNYGSGNVTLVGLDADGVPGAITAEHRFVGGSKHWARQSVPHPHCAVPSSDGSRLLAVDLGGDRLVTFSVHPDRLVEVSRTPVRSGAGPRHATVRDRDGLVLVANELHNSISTYRPDGEGTLTAIDSMSTLSDVTAENLVAAIRLSTNGDVVYISNRGADSIASFDIDEDGYLRRRRERPCGGSWPRDFLLLPGDDHLLVANEHSNAVTVIDLDGTIVSGVEIAAPTSLIVRPTPTVTR